MKAILIIVIWIVALFFFCAIFGNGKDEEIMKKKKLYFPDWDDCICSDLEDLKLEAKEQDISEFDATEAVPENMRHTDVYWCKEYGDFVDICECCKPECEDYAPNKSGRGTCKYRGCCYIHGTKKIHVKI